MTERLVLTVAGWLLAIGNRDACAGTKEAIVYPSGGDAEWASRASLGRAGLLPAMFGPSASEPIDAGQ